MTKSKKSRPAGFHNIDPNPSGWPIIGKHHRVYKKRKMVWKGNKFMGRFWVMK